MRDRKTVGAIIVALVAIAAVAGTILANTNNEDSTSKVPEPASSASTEPTGSEANKRQADTSEPVETTEVSIRDYLYTPMIIKVKAGDTVTWTNEDSVSHNVVADQQSPDSPNGPLIGKGETYKFTFTKAGTYTYYCGPHPYMKGTVIVTES